MPRIPQEEIDHIKRTVSVAELARAAGVELRGNGENLVGRCKWHDDETASLIVTPAKNLWHCMGACQIGGDVYAWVMKNESVIFTQAHIILKKIAPPMPEQASPVRPGMSDDEMMRAVVDYYVMRGEQRSDFQAYLKKRGIDSPEMIARFRIGYAPAFPRLTLPALSLKEETLFRARLQKLGILRAPRAIEHMAGSLVVPIFDADGNVVEMYGRKIRDDLREGTAYHLYLPGPHRGVWNLEALRESKEIILCEAAIDALTFWRWGFRNVTWSYGVEGFTRDHLAAFKAYGTERVLIAYDRDEAGDRAAEKLAAKLRGEGITCYRVEFPKGMDANEYAKKVTPADKSLAILIKNAALMGMGNRPDVDPDPTPSVAADPRDEAEDESEPEPAIEAEKPAPPLAAPPVEISRKPIASPVVEPPKDLDIDVRNENEVCVTFGDRAYRIRGMKKNTSFESLRINVMLTRSTNNAVYLDTFDLSVNRQRTMFEKSAAVEIGVKEEVLHREMGQILCALERIRDEAIERGQEKKNKVPEMTAEDRAEALDHLMSPNLVRRTLDHLTLCGLVGEEINKLMLHLACTSRKLARPLAVIVQSSSAAGKTILMDTVISFMPPEEVVRYSAITGKALFYVTDPSALKHKILAISEEQGAEQATYALKLLQSEGKLSIFSTGKDPHSGRLEAQEYHVEGPIMPVMSTTAAEVDEELQNRCIVLTSDESSEQTRAIHERQRTAQTIEGFLGSREGDRVMRIEQNSQRLLRAVIVFNPYAEALTFLHSKTRMRRDHLKYLVLIQTVTLFHQYQRERKIHVVPGTGEQIEYIEVTVGDIEIANQLAHEVLGRSLDELAPQTRRMLNHLLEMVTQECERLKMMTAEYFFTQRQVREFTGWSDQQVKLHLRKLVDLEYVLVHRGGRGQSFVYELLYRGEGESKKHFMMGLIDVAKLRSDDNRVSSKADRVDEKRKRDISGTPQVPIGYTPGSTLPIARKPSADAALRDSEAKSREKTLLGKPRQEEPVTSDVVTGALALPKPSAKKPRTYLLRREDDGNGRAPVIRRVLYRRWTRAKRSE